MVHSHLCNVCQLPAVGTKSDGVGFEEYGATEGVKGMVANVIEHRLNVCLQSDWPERRTAKTVRTAYKRCK